MKYKNIFKCDCGNHAFFLSSEPTMKGATFDTECSYELGRKTMQWVKCVKVENLS